MFLTVPIQSKNSQNFSKVPSTHPQHRTSHQAHLTAHFSGADDAIHIDAFLIGISRQMKMVEQAKQDYYRAIREQAPDTALGELNKYQNILKEYQIEQRGQYQGTQRLHDAMDNAVRQGRMAEALYYLQKINEIEK